MTNQPRDERAEILLAGVAFGWNAAIAQVVALVAKMKYPTSADPEHWAEWLRGLADDGEGVEALAWAWDAGYDAGVTAPNPYRKDLAQDTLFGGAA